MARRVLVALSFVLAALSGPKHARACSTCACGDSTLTATGVERPYKNRVRITLDERYGSLALGQDITRHETWYVRSTLAASWSPHDRVTVTAQLPWMSSWIRTPQLGLDSINGLADLELGVRGIVYRERRFAPQHLLWLSGGIKFPTGPRVAKANGYPYPDDEQPGSGSWDPFLGLTYAWIPGGLVSVYVSTTGRATTPNERGYHRGSSVGLASAVQLQPWNRVAFLLGVNAGYSDRDRMNAGAALPNSGGFVMTAAPGILINPVADLLLRVDADIPMVTSLYGIQHFGPQARLSVAYDIR